MNKLFKDTLVLENASVKTSKFGNPVIAGQFSKAEEKNQNERIYKMSTWRKILEAASVQNALARRKMLGELGHPEIVETTLKDVSHIVTKLELRPDGVVYGEAEILDTPSGRILKTLYDAGVELGISSRGYIPEDDDLIPTSEGYVIPDSYELVTFDFVIDPSSAGALPKLQESTQKQLSAILAEGKGVAPRVRKLVTEACITKKVKEEAEIEVPDGAKIEIFLPAMDTEVLDKIEELGYEDLNTEDTTIIVDISGEPMLWAAKLKRFVESLKTVNCSITVNSNGKKRKVLTLLNSSSKSTESASMESKNKSLQKKLDLSQDVLESVVARYKASCGIISEMADSQKNAEYVITQLKNRYLISEKVIEDLKAYVLGLEEVVSKLAKMYNVSEKTIANLLSRYTLSEKDNKNLRSSLKAKSELIGDLRHRYTLSIDVVESLAAEYKSLEKKNATLSAENADLKKRSEAIQVSIAKQAPVKESKAVPEKKIVTDVKSVKSVQPKKKSSSYSEFPISENLSSKKRVAVKESTDSYMETDNLANLVSRAFK